MGWSSIHLAACDIDGDMRDELILNDDNSIAFITFKNGKASLLWTVEDPAPAPPILAGLTPKGDIKLMYGRKDGCMKI